MKTLKLLVLCSALTLISVNSFAQSKSDTIKVYGNCDHCKEHIEKAATTAGATDANWSDETLLLVVNYDASKTNNLNIQKSIASFGYDTQDVKASDDAYKKLDKCCRYDRGEAKPQ